MKSAVLSGLLDQALPIVRKAGALLSDRGLARQIQHKGKTDFVTDVDIAVQEQIREGLERIDGSIRFMSEEQDNSSILQDNSSVSLNGPTWILDPVDGTTNLIHGIWHSAISLALAEGDKVLLGIIFDPFASEIFTAQLGCGAFCNGRPIHVSDTAGLSDSLCSTGTNPGCREHADAAFRRMRAVYDRCHDIRRIGAASIELCYVACGRLDGYLEHGLKPWDYAAGKRIVEEAGGKITDFCGEDPSQRVNRCDILATNGCIHHDLQALLESL